ncbi:hypothetical protein [Aeromicrobium sp. NPDC092404]|uniref:hypothetical protein n=1 Tax=Aeromicrobium sp. NPDC092404 TaxID=3154976 RepID=UPI00341B8B03
MLRRMTVFAAGLLLLAGCGGGSDDGDADKPTAKPTPRTYTLAQLTAAMPEKPDIPGAKKVEPRCPDEKDSCDPSKKIVAQRSVHVELKATPSELSPVEQEEAANAPGIGEFVQISAAQYGSESDAAAAVASVRAANAKAGGTYADKPKKLEGDQYQPGVTGTGRVDDLSIRGWKGVIAPRRIVLSSPEGLKSRPILDAVVSISRGATVVSGSVAVYRGKGDADAAVVLIEKVLEDYLERLES